MTDATTSPQLDVVAIGNALVDVLSHEDDDFVDRLEVGRGVMTMIDGDRAETLYAAMGPGTEMSGGSAANTAAGVASFGGTAGFIGKVRDDQLGEVFAHDLRSIGVHFSGVPAAEGPATGRCLIVVTPDAQRSMSTYLGIASEITPEDVDTELLANAKVTYVEGYLWDQPDAIAAISGAAEAVHAAGRRFAFTLSDPFCVDRHRAEFVDLLDAHVDVLFANEAELLSLYEVDDFEEALARVGKAVEIAAVTRSEFGSVVINGDAVGVVPAEPAQVVDTTGAGDLYAAGFLYGLTQGFNLSECARLGSIGAAEVISHLGARPLVRLADLI